MSTSSDEFAVLARSYFDFLITDFGFVLTKESSSLGCGIRYDNPTFYVSVLFYKGELQVVLWVKIDTQIIRPASPRSFYLDEILPHLLEDPFRNAPKGGDHSSFVSAAELKFCADSLKQHCAHILRGDLSLLERLSKERDRTVLR
ncbi:MAG: hypothetical protein JWM68_348 [Verrucomicrobiales bacterium]|nr:hypothetical protein [Verrucomicrobiales bacterium]